MIHPYRALKTLEASWSAPRGSPAFEGRREPMDWEAVAIVCSSGVSRNLRTRERGRELLGEGYTV